MNQAEDVEVVLGYGRRYKFHSGTLARNSPLLADMLVEPNAVKFNYRAKNAGIKTRWMLELTTLPNDEFPAGRLELVKLNSSGERADGCHGLIVNENGLIPQAAKVFEHYEAIFYAFYNKDLEIDETDMSTVLSDCCDLIEISDYLGCTQMISKPIEVALLKHGQDLFITIQQNPSAWINLSDRIRSESLFKECFIHLVGNWKALQSNESVKENLSDIPGLIKLVERYHLDLVERGQGLELAITSFYPGDMKTPTDDLPIRREAYGRDILIWMALAFFRQWFVQHLVEDKGRHSADCGYKLYRKISMGDDAYMDRTVISQFHAKFPMTTKALHVLENHLLEIKNYMKDVVKQQGILKPNCQLDIHRFPVNYLTCTNFRRYDYPWMDDYAGSRGLSEELEYKPGGNEITKQNHKNARMAQKRGLGVGQMNDEEGRLLGGDYELVPHGKRARWG